MKYNLVTILMFALLAAVLFLPLLLLELLPFARRAAKGRWLNWLLGIAAYAANILLLAGWTGDILESSQGDLSISAFWIYMVTYLVAPFFYAVFFREGKRSAVYAAVTATIMLLATAGMALVPILYGVNPSLGLTDRIFGITSVCLPQALNALFYILLVKRANDFRRNAAEQPSERNDRK